MASLIQNIALGGGTGTLFLYGDPVRVSRTAHFVSNTVAGNSLICIIAANVFYNAGGDTGNVATLAPPLTPGVSWVLVDQIIFGEQSTNPSLLEGQNACALAVYYAYAAPSVPSTTNTTCVLTAPAETRNSEAGAYAYMWAAMFEISGAGNSLTVATQSISDQTLAAYVADPGLFPSNIPSFYTRPTAGSISVANAGDFVLVAINTLSFLDSLPSAPGYTRSWFSQFQVASASGSLDTSFASGARALDWAVIAVSIGGGGFLAPPPTASCAGCSGEAFLGSVPGFSDVPDSVLAQEQPVFGLHLGEIAVNGHFGMVRCEVFQCLMKHGDTVPLPVSCADGYPYSRDELLYMWTVQSSMDPSTNWISGPDCLWFANWQVDQTTGDVFSEEWYERSSSADSRLAAKSNDGVLTVYTIAQRQLKNMLMAAPASYTAIDESKIATDKPYPQTLIQNLNDNAKFASVGTEVFYLGEYVNGDVVKLPVSPVDGHVYTAAECAFMHAWRWTANGGSYTQPPGQDEQAAPFQAAIDSSGNVAITVSFSTAGGDAIVTETGYGRIAAFAFCRRTGGPGSLALANAFEELAVDSFFPGMTVRASTLLAIKRNIDEAIMTPEFFGPTTHVDADTVPLPTSPVDGYVYDRTELRYIWSWKDTKNNLGGTHDRLPFFLGSIDPSSGKVLLQTWRLPPGGPYLNDGDSGVISVITMANRKMQHGVIAQFTSPNSPSDAGTVVTDVATNAFSMGLFIPGSPTSASQLIVRVVLPDPVTFAAGMAPSTSTAGAASTGTSVFTFTKNGTAFATLTFTSSATGVFAAATATSFNGTTDVLAVIGPSTIDASLADIGIVARGTR